MNTSHGCRVLLCRPWNSPQAAWLLAVIATLVVAAGCDKGSQQTAPTTPGPGHSSAHNAGSGEIALPKADQKLCTAVAILLDTSGSMKDPVVDRNRVKMPKHMLARNALRKIITYTEQWKKTHPDRALQLGLFSFSDEVRAAVPIADFNMETATAGLKSIPKPNGGTAIGTALQQGFQALYASGCTRKYIVCITDGENTVGTTPDVIARQLYKQTGGEVEIHFVAFDTTAAKFGFLSGVNGYVVEADGSQLDSRLSDIYEKRILAETMPAER